MSGDGCHEDKAGECRITKWERKSGECLGGTDSRVPFL